MLTKEQVVEAYKNKDYDLLVLKNIRLIYEVLRRNYLKDDEYYDVGVIGLVRGVQTFDITRGTMLSTYLYRCIHNEIINEYKAKLRRCPPAVSLDKPVGDGMDCFIDFLEASESKCLADKDEEERALGIIDNYSKKEKGILYHYFGLNGYEKLTQKQIGDKYGYSKTGIHNYKKRLLKDLERRLER